MDLPLNPTLGQTETIAGRTWRYNGVAWDAVAPGTLPGTAQLIKKVVSYADFVEDTEGAWVGFPYAPIYTINEGDTVTFVPPDMPPEWVNGGLDSYPVQTLGGFAEGPTQLILYLYSMPTSGEATVSFYVAQAATAPDVRELEVANPNAKLIEVEITPQTPGLYTAEGANLVPEGMTLLAVVGLKIEEVWDNGGRLIQLLRTDASLQDTNYGSYCGITWPSDLSSGPAEIGWWSTIEWDYGYSKFGLGGNFIVGDSTGSPSSTPTEMVSTTGRAIVRLLCAQAIPANSAKLLPTVTDGTTSIAAPGTLTFEGATVTNSGGNAVVEVASSVLKRTVTITAAQLADLHNTPVELVPAPGPGKWVVPVQIAGHGTGVYGVETGGIGLWWRNADDPNNFGNFAFYSYGVVIDRFALGGTSGATTGAENAALITGPTGPLPILGAITASSINNGGTGWAVNDTFKVGDAEFVVTSVDAPETGVVTGYTKTSPGVVDSNIASTELPYPASPAWDASGTGTDLTIDITELDYSVNPMTLKITTLYTIIDV